MVTFNLDEFTLNKKSLVRNQTFPSIEQRENPSSFKRIFGKWLSN
jgi:hypothetical protein